MRAFIFCTPSKLKKNTKLKIHVFKFKLKNS